LHIDIRACGPILYEGNTAHILGVEMTCAVRVSLIRKKIHYSHGTFQNSEGNAPGSVPAKKGAAEASLCYDLRMSRGLADIQLEVRGGDISVDLPGTSYTVTYHKPAICRQLLGTCVPAKDDPRTELTQGEFLAKAWRLANDKARELGWIA
jgi:hypothetical protein